MTGTKRKLTKNQKQRLIPKRNLKPEECLELQEIQRVVNARVWEYNQLKGNTALIPEGQKLVEQAKAVCLVLDDAKRQWVAQKLVECGYPYNTLCDINMNTGEIYVKVNLPDL